MFHPPVLHRVNKMLQHRNSMALSPECGLISCKCAGRPHKKGAFKPRSLLPVRATGKGDVRKARARRAGSPTPVLPDEILAPQLSVHPNRDVSDVARPPSGPAGAMQKLPRDPRIEANGLLPIAVLIEFSCKLLIPASP